MVESVAAESALPRLGGWNAVGFPICLDPIAWVEKKPHAVGHIPCKRSQKNLNIIENPFV